jgi:hypothetical protein
MKGRTPLLLLGILALLSAYIYFVEIRGKVQMEKKQTKSKTLLTIEKKDIQKITVKRPSNSFSCIRNGEDVWRLLSPVDDTADKSAMESFISSLSDLKKEGEISEVAQPADYGLGASSTTVVVTSKSGVSDTLVFGDKTPTGTGLYLRKPRENRVIFANTGVETFYSKPIFDLRDKSALPYKEGDVERIQIESFGRVVALVKSAGAWNIAQPIQAKADESAVESFLNQIKWAQAKEYVEENPKSVHGFGLSQPKQSVTLTMGADQSQKTLAIGRAKTKDRYFARDASRLPVFLVDSALVREFKKTAFDFLDKKIARFETDSVKSVIVNYLDRPSLVCRKDTGDVWFMESPRKTRALAYKIDAILYDVRDMQARDYLGEKTAGLSAYGLARPRIRITFKNKKGETLVDLSVGNRAGNKLTYVMNAKTRAVYKADDTFMNNMKPNIDEIIEKAEVKPEQAKKTDSRENKIKKQK